MPSLKTCIGFDCLELTATKSTARETRSIIAVSMMFSTRRGMSPRARATSARTMLCNSVVV